MLSTTARTRRLAFRLPSPLLPIAVGFLSATAHAFELSFSPVRAPVPEVEHLTIAEDGTVTTHYTARDGRFYILWVSDNPDNPGTPIQLRVPPAPGSDTIVFDPSSLPVIPEWLPNQAYFRITNPRTDEFTDHDDDSIDDLYEAARSKDVRPDLPPDQWLNPFDYRDADRDPFIDEDNDGMDDDDRKNWEIYLDNLNQRFEHGSGEQDISSNESPPPAQDLELLLNIDIINNAASDYTPSFDGIGNIRMDDGIALANPTEPGFQYAGTYYYGVKDESDRGSTTHPFGAAFAISDDFIVRRVSVEWNNFGQFWQTKHSLFATYQVDPSTGRPIISIPAGSRSSSAAAWPVVFADRPWPVSPGTPLQFVDRDGWIVSESSAAGALMYIDEFGCESTEHQTDLALDVWSGKIFRFEKSGTRFSLSGFELSALYYADSGELTFSFSSAFGSGVVGETTFDSTVTLLFPAHAARIMREFIENGERYLYLDANLNRVEPTTAASFPARLSEVEVRKRAGFSPYPVPLDHEPAKTLEEIHLTQDMNIGFFSDALTMREPWSTSQDKPGFNSAIDGTLVSDPQAYALEHSKLVYVARYASNQTEYPDDPMLKNSAKVIAFPLVESPASFTLYPETESPSAATLRTSTSDPRSHLNVTGRLTGKWNYRYEGDTRPHGYPLVPASTNGGIYINEIQPPTLGDGFIELSNQSQRDFRGMYLSDDPDDLTKVRIDEPHQTRFPVLEWPSQAFPVTGQLTFLLTDSDGTTVIDMVSACAPPDGSSLSKADNSSWFFDPTPTPGGGNTVLEPGEMLHSNEGIQLHPIDVDGIDHRDWFAQLGPGELSILEVGQIWSTSAYWYSGAGYSSLAVNSTNFPLASGATYTLEFQSHSSATPATLDEDDPLALELPGLLTPTSEVIAFDEDAAEENVSPEGFEASNAVDANRETDYANLGGANSGLVIIPGTGPTIVKGFTVTTVHAERDWGPKEWELHGTNDPVSIAGNRITNLVSWTPIASGTARLNTNNLTEFPLNEIDNIVPFLAYKFIVRSTVDPDAQRVQFAELQFYGETQHIDAHLRSARLLPLQILSDLNSNNFGTFTVPLAGISAIDPTLLSDDLTDEGYVGLADGGSQVGTLHLATAASTNVVLATPDGTIDRDGTYPWLRDHVETSEGAITANYPAGLRAGSGDTIQVFGANLSAHSLEFSLPSLDLRDSTLTATGTAARDALTGAIHVTDPTGTPLGYLRLFQQNGAVSVSNSSLTAATDLDVVAVKASLAGGTFTARTGDLTVGAHSLDINGQDSRALFGAQGGILLHGSPPTPQSHTSAGLTIGFTGDGHADLQPADGAALGTPTTGHGNIVRIDNFPTFTIGRTSIESRVVLLRSLATPEHALIEALDCDGLPLTINGTTTWRADTKETYDGTDAVRSPSLREDERATLNFKLDRSGYVSFWWKTNTRDTLASLYIDDSLEVRSEPYEWQFVRVHVTASTTAEISFEAFQQSVGGTGDQSDSAVWIDQLNFEPEGGDTLLDALDIASSHIRVFSDGDPWVVDTSVSHDGVDAVRSPPTELGGFRRLFIEIDTPGEISFWWREQDNSLDAAISIFGVAPTGTPGPGGWQFVQERLTFPVTYIDVGYYNNSASTGPDSGVWIDQIKFAPAPTTFSPAIHPSSLLDNTTIHTTKLARIYSNHQLLIRNHVTVQNPEIAALELTVEPGATLELTGDNPRVFANTHNYGHGDFGTLLINGTPQNGASKRPNFHLRPHFEEE